VVLGVSTDCGPDRINHAHAASAQKYSGIMKRPSRIRALTGIKLKIGQEGDDHNRQQCRNAPSVGRSVIVETPKEGMKADNSSWSEESSNSDQASPVAVLRACKPFPVCREQCGCCQPIKRRLMIGKPRHPIVGWRFDQEVEGIRQKREQAIKRSNDKIGSRGQPKQRIHPQLQRDLK